MQEAISLLSRIDGFTVRRLSGYGRHSLVSPPSELARAHRIGVQVQKLFPAPNGDEAFVRSVLSAMPFLCIVPTNGITAANCCAYLDAGAAAVGSGAALFIARDLEQSDWAAIEGRCRRLCTVVRRWQEQHVVHRRPNTRS